MEQESSIQGKSGLISFEVISKINGIDVDLRAISREYGIGEAEISREELLRIAQNSGFKAKIKTMPLENTRKYPIPAIFVLKNNTYGVLLKTNYDENKLLMKKGNLKKLLIGSFTILLRAK